MQLPLLEEPFDNSQQRRSTYDINIAGRWVNILFFMKLKCHGIYGVANAFVSWHFAGGGFHFFPADLGGFLAMRRFSCGFLCVVTWRCQALGSNKINNFKREALRSFCSRRLNSEASIIPNILLHQGNNRNILDKI